MRLIAKVLLVLALVGLTTGPAAAAPSLSLHLPTLTAPSAPSSAPSKPGTLPLLPFGLAGITIRKDVGSIAAKYKTRASAAAPDYQAGVAAAGPDWEAATKAAEGNYEAGVQQSIADKRFGKGVSAAGAAKYIDNAVKLGPQRFQTGVQNAENAYSRGVQPHIEAMRNMTLPPRGPKGSPQNMERANVVAARNRAIKLGK